MTKLIINYIITEITTTVAVTGVLGFANVCEYIEFISKS